MFFGSQANEYFARLPAPAAAGQLSACIRGMANPFPGCNTGGVPNFPALCQLGQGYTNYFDQSDESWSVFTQDTFHITEQLSLAAGVRYNHEHKHGIFASLYQANTLGTCPATDGSGDIFLPISLQLLCPRPS